MIVIDHQGEYINFTCDKCKRNVKVVSAKDDRKPETYDTRHIHIMQIDLKCEGCGDEKSVKMRLLFPKG